MILVLLKWKDIKLKDEEIFLIIGEEYNLKDNVISKDKVKYINMSQDKIFIDSNGTLLAHNIGDAKVIYEDNNGKRKELNIHIKTNLESINILDDKVKIVRNSNVNLQYIFFPLNAPIGDLNWSSSNEDVVQIEDGNLIGIDNGKATITLTGSNGVYDTCEVEVCVAPEKIDLDKYNIKMYVDESITLKATILPIDTNDKNIKWESSNSSVATVDSNGKVKALKSGKVVISATTNNGLKAICNIDVKNVLAKSIEVDRKLINLKVGDVDKLKATIYPNNTYDKTITWVSSDESIATIDSNGKIIARKPGKVTITALTTNKQKSYCDIVITSQTKGKSIIFMGDSVTYGYSSTPVGYSWANYIKDNYDLKSTTNVGMSGWTISYGKYNSIVSKIKDYKDNKYDYVILQGGTNDISYGVPLGTYDIDDYSGNYDNKTFLGGLENYIYTTKTTWPDAKIGYIIMYETPNSNESRRVLSPKYYNEMKKVLDKWNIPYLDLYFGSTPDGIKYSDLLVVKGKKYVSDGLHLNRDGYNKISPYIYMWMNSL